MNTRRFSGLRILTLTALCLACISTRAAVLIGNYPPPDDSIPEDIITGFFQIAAGFTVPSTGYTVDDVVLRLGNYDTTSGTAAAVGFYTDNGGVPGSLVGSLLNAPSSSSTAIGDFTFTPSGTVTLSANTSYWLLVDASNGSYQWWAPSSHQIPSGAAT